jgi:hypothetical protein
MRITLAYALFGQMRIQANRVSKLFNCVDGCSLLRYPFFKEVSCCIT